MEYKVGDKIEINYMEDEPRYKGRIGVITKIDDEGQLHGTWGGLAVMPEKDICKIVSNNIEESSK